ncbi:2-dehydropantoate 2-reductase [Neptuniibacter sp.]|uniref:2-dehydropantoate 2-reductase n=1 Tax=Neptuniibacter sp. TaxID=1962643 RepID=UPI0026071C44|nr:2-dehydropantoate 2-reductase [Neptuniibacter sp.]MCP4594982.1 2-dehydropantoate 2-reductase [Neptuniibacter sp.]
MKKRWHILGAGAIGNLWACHLTSAGFPVTLILRSQDKLNSFSDQHGIKLKEELYLADAELADSPYPIEQLLITTKSTDTKTAFNSIRTRISSHARVIVLQNGMGTQQWVREQLPSAEVVWASTTDGAWLKQPFDLVHAGQGYTRMGIPDQECYWLEELGNGFLKIELDDDIAKTLWRKLAINCAINPLSAHFQCKNGELINNPNYLVEMAAICREVEAVTSAAGIKLFDGPLIEHACQVAELTAENYSSMMQDVKHGRSTEISSITGYLCKLAEQHNISIPVNQKYLKKIQELQT